MKKKAYYYTAVISISEKHYKYFKAYSKRQVRKHLMDDYNVDCIVCDPSDKPSKGINYADITHVQL